MDKWQGWQLSIPQEFWGEIAPCEQVIQFYEHTDVLLDTLTAYVGDGISSNDCTIVIATREHLDSLESRLTAYGANVNSLISEDLYIPLDAEQTLQQIMRNNWPDTTLFVNMVTGLLQRARLKNRGMRVFGEMVALLWAQDNGNSSMQLAKLWNQMRETEDITVFCAYPKSGFTEGAEASMRNICEAHTRVISGKTSSEQSLLFKNTVYHGSFYSNRRIGMYVEPEFISTQHF